MSIISFVSPLFSSLSSNTLFSCIFTLYLIIFLYTPHSLFHLFLSPVFISTFILLLTLLRSGVSQQIQLHNNPKSTQIQSPLEPDPEPKPDPIISVEEKTDQLHCTLVRTLPKTELNSKIGPELEPIKAHPIEILIETEYDPELELEPFKINHVETLPKTDYGPKPEADQRKEEPEEIISNWIETQSIEQCKSEPDPNPYPFRDQIFFMEWDMGAPLEVIYEACENEEEEKDEENNGYKEWSRNGKTEYPSLSRCYPESGSDSGSDSSGSLWGREITSIEEWVEDEGEGLIEIALDYHINNNYINNKDGKEGINNKLMEVVNFDDEDNLIEIDISPRRIIDYGFSWSL